MSKCSFHLNSSLVIWSPQGLTSGWLRSSMKMVMVFPIGGPKVLPILLSTEDSSVFCPLIRENLD